ncbi:hypothetical protein UFOVP299_49 [uncultured Caudovirales phage]|uniref:Uncharacterized protein n=1 Tax=uncultured Caudovirales phage TaxID=2100421 RepID=A0A6J5LT51_9CAUD|nr:hypothetical protein UFOVP299_49 [uncultured Caudovirales phage]
MKAKKPAPAINTKVQITLLTFFILIVSVLMQL